MPRCECGEIKGKGMLDSEIKVVCRIKWCSASQKCQGYSWQRILKSVFLSFLSVFEEPEDPNNRSFFSEIISSISDVKFSHSGRYMMTRDYLSVKIWDLNMETRPVETYQVCVHPHVKRVAILLLRIEVLKMY